MNCSKRFRWKILWYVEAIFVYGRISTVPDLKHFIKSSAVKTSTARYLLILLGGTQSGRTYAEVRLVIYTLDLVITCIGLTDCAAIAKASLTMQIVTGSQLRTVYP